jgi:hypothetical protein
MTSVEKVENEDGSVTWLSSDGKEYKTKSGAWKRSKKLEGEESSTDPSEPKIESEPEVEWSTMEFTESDITEVIPAPLKKIKARSGKPTKQQLENERGMNEAILKTGYKTGDVLLTRYKRAVLKDEDAPAVKHSEEDYDWISSVTQDALDHNGVNFASAIGPTQIALISNSVWFGKPLISIQAESGNKFLSGGRMVRTLERIPFIGKRIRDRRMRKIEAEMLKEME